MIQRIQQIQAGLTSLGEKGCMILNEALCCTMGVPWVCHGCAMRRHGVPWVNHADSMLMPWVNHADAMLIPC